MIARTTRSVQFNISLDRDALPAMLPGLNVTRLKLDKTHAEIVRTTTKSIVRLL